MGRQTASVHFGLRFHFEFSVEDSGGTCLRLKRTDAENKRCPSTTGYNAPCHLDYGWRVDNKERQDATGGWHEACDLRKWVDATLYGMLGLGRLAQVRAPESGTWANAWRNCAGATATSCTCGNPRA